MKLITNNTHIYKFVLKSYQNFKQFRVLHIFASPTMADAVAVEVASVEKKLSKRAQRKLVAKERRKHLRKLNKGLTRNQDPGFNSSLFDSTEYYFENGLRKVYPYYFTFSSFAKERWVGKTVEDVFKDDFRCNEAEEYVDAIETGKIRVNNKPVTLDYIVKNNDYLEHTLHRHENPVVGTPLDILVDNKDVIVINKPASIPCHPCGRYRFNSIAFILGKEYGHPHLRNLYRLDRLTSGVLILAKTAEITRKYEDHIAGRHVQKEYVCRVVGEFPEGDIVCEEPLDVINHKISLFRVKPGGKPSKTTFRRMSYNGKSSVVKCFPVTGRTHQIRVHLQYLGHPIINDPLYNSPAFGPNRGKGGEFWKTEAEITAEIRTLHNIGLWYDGENPLYRKRLKEIKESQQQNDTLVSDPKTELSQESADSTEPEIKKVKIDNTESINNEKCDNTEKEGGDRTVETSVSGIDDSTKTQSDNVMFKESSKKADAIEYKDFDETKWIPDESCSSCRRNYLDPTPNHLVMFLHALKYKGPDWEYSTDIPEWAGEDWEENCEEEKTSS